ncbi:hypothetical protein [Sphingomonas sp.]|uniref:LpxL/LpxP family acyltransferase n=1 Tax=Sphingomonas sp. TaxID=28214 RepID=UPI003B3B9CF9
MPAFIRERFSRDLATGRSARGNVDIPGIVAGWMNDRAWQSEAARIGDQSVTAELHDLGAQAFVDDAGHYASELRANTRGLDAWWLRTDRERFLKDHVSLLFMAAADEPAMARYRDDARSMEVAADGFDLLATYRGNGSGLLLLGINQGHPGPLIFHPALEAFEIGVVQHSPGVRTPVNLTRDGRVRALPASTIGCRHARDLLLRGQCVLVANDYVFEGVPTLASPLFGDAVPIARALVALALRSRATILPISYERQVDAPARRYFVRVFPGFTASDLGLCDMMSLAKAMGRITEALICRAPEQWRLWNTLQDRWRTADRAT